MKPPEQGVSVNGFANVTFIHGAENNPENPVNKNRKSQFIEVDGWTLPAYDTHFRSHLDRRGRYQAKTCNKLIELAKDPFDSVCLDIGAHVGFFTSPLASAFAHVIAFEPIPSNYMCLESNIAGCGNVTIVRAAVGPLSWARFYLQTPGNSGSWAFIHQEGAENGGAPVVPLDMFETSARISAIKIDVQGMEMGVLMSGEKLLSEHRPVICVENKSQGVVNHEIQRYLEGRGARLLQRVNKDIIMGWE